MSQDERSHKVVHPWPVGRGGAQQRWIRHHDLARARGGTGRADHAWEPRGLGNTVAFTVPAAQEAPPELSPTSASYLYALV